LIFSNLSAAAAFLVTFCAVAKSYKNLIFLEVRVGVKATNSILIAKQLYVL